MDLKSMLVVDDEAGIRETLRVLFSRQGFSVDLASGVKDAEQKISSHFYDVVVSDLSMPDGSGIQVLEAARKRDDSTQVVLITAYAATDQAVQAMRLGAYDYVQKPFQNDALRVTIEKALEKRWILNENRRLRAQVGQIAQSRQIVGKSPTMMRVMQLIAKVAPTKSNVLITGESGTGKEVIAHAIHTQSTRANGPFIVVNCGALPEALMESELFGHEKGAFSGAISQQEGLVRASSKGTLFLDEIGELSLPLQVKLLRVLQEHKVRPVGGQHELPVDARVIAATNRDLESEMRDGKFRQDLFYRLNVIRIHLSPLRERREDIHLLAAHLLQKHAREQAKALDFSAAALRWLLSYDYPGNVRELENIVERAVTLSAGNSIEIEDLPDSAGPIDPSTILSLPMSADFDLDKYLHDVERRFILQALEETQGNRTAAARRLGMTFRSFRYRLAKLGLESDPELPE